MILNSFCLPWGIGNIAFGIILESFTLMSFGFGLLIGGLCIAIEWDIEMFEMRVKLNKLKKGED